MQYQLCSRCKFKVPVNRHLCSTCGNVMPPLNVHTVANAEPMQSTSKSEKATLWQQAVNFAMPHDNKKEAGHDDHALGRV